RLSWTGRYPVAEARLRDRRGPKGDVQVSSTRPQSSAGVPTDAIDRLLASWRAEIEAGMVYELLARRQPDPRRAELIRRLAAAEGTHRVRIEARLAELGVPLPDPASVGLSWWRRLQVRFAPMERVLAAQEAAEEVEVRDRYRRPTGDAPTDALLADIRHDENAHARELETMRTGNPPSQAAGPRAALDRILRHETGHSTGSGWISGAIYGANDGLAAVFGLVSGVSGATGGSHL